MYTGLNGNLTITALDNVMPTTDDKYSTTKYSYNQFGQLVKKIDPLGKEETYEYDLNGLLKQYKDRNESIISYNRDALDRMLNRSVTTTDGSGNEAYSYSYYLTGARKSMSGGDINTNYIYDDLGRVTQEIESNGTTKEYTYDAANNRKSFVVKQNGSLIMNTTYEYDNMNRLYKTYENGQIVATYAYDTNGNRDILTYGNGVSTKYDYNLANKMKTLTNKNSTGAALSKFDYTYYLDGNQASKSDSEGVISYKYDGLSRISSVEGPNGLYKNYGYDDNNNRLYLSGNDEIFINDTDISYKYDGFNQLKSAVNQTTTTYSYNGDGIRTSKNVGGILTTHILDGGNVAADISSTITKYVRGINLICSEINGQRYYYLYNGHGDVIQIIDNNGTVVNNYKYDEWGNIVSQTEGIENPFKYCGEYYDKETGLYYLRARYYDPTTGRFINEDSFLGNDRDPLSLNLYTYCSGNPIIYVDPSGYKQKVSNYTFEYEGKNVTVKKYTFTEIGLTVYGSVNCDGALFNNDPVKAYEGYRDSITSYEDNKNGVAIWDIKSLKKIDNDAWWNGVKMWGSTGISAVADIVSVVKIAKAVKAGNGMIEITSDIGKSYLVPENIIDNPEDVAGLANRSIGIYDSVKAQEASVGKRAINYGLSMTPIVGTAISIYNSINYEYIDDDDSYSQGHDYDWYED